MTIAIQSTYVRTYRDVQMSLSDEDRPLNRYVKEVSQVVITGLVETPDDVDKYMEVARQVKQLSKE